MPNVTTRSSLVGCLHSTIAHQVEPMAWWNVYNSSSGRADDLAECGEKNEPPNFRVVEDQEGMTFGVPKKCTFRDNLLQIV